MTSGMLMRGLWVAAAGACIALGAGHGVAAAETDSTDGGTAQSSPSVSQPAAGPVSTGTKDVDKGQDSADDPKGVDKPTTTVSASTVTVDRDETAVSEPAAVTSAAKSATRSETPTKAEVALARSEVLPVDETTAVTARPSNPVDDVATPVVVTAKAGVNADAITAKPTPDTEVSPNVAVIRSLASPVVHAPQAGPLATVVISLLSAFGLLPPAPAAPVPVVGTVPPAIPGTSAIDGVTGVKVGSSNVQIPVGSSTYTGAADWYFPTQADGTVQAQGVMWLQHGFLGSKSWYSALGQQLAQQTNSIVVVPNVPSFPFFTCGGCSLSDVSLQEGVAALFADPGRTSLNLSATAAGYQGLLPEKFILTGHSAGGGLAAAAGGFYADAVAPGDNDLLGVVMFDGVSSNDTVASALASLGARNTPVYQIAAPPQPWNANGETTDDLVALRPGQFVGAVLANGSHVDSLIGGALIIDFLSQLLIKPSPPGNTQAVYTLAAGWINDMYAGLGPTDPRYGIYGEPGQHLVLGPTAAVVLGLPPVVDVAVVRNSNGGARLLLGRTRTVSDDLYQELLDRASVERVESQIPPTRPPAAELGAVAV